MPTTTSKLATVRAYVKGLPPERRAAIGAVRKVIVANLPAGYKESIGWGMIVYCIPLKSYANTYNGQPLAIACLGAQKNYNSLYLMGAYGSPKHRKALEDGFRKAGKKLNMGKSCVRFKTVEDLPLDVIAEVIAAIPADKYIELYEASRKK